MCRLDREKRGVWVYYRVMHCRSISPKLYFTGAKLKYIEER